MHIPDGYLGPKTLVFFYALMLPVWYLASRGAKRALDARQLPLVAFSSAFVFVIMMFNFPVPGGTTGHIVGGALTSIALGPWVGVLSMSLALFLQAIVFADGGVTAYGANSFNMAFLMSFSGYYTFRVLNRAEEGEKFRWAASFFAGYVAVNMAALSTALILGCQPLLEHDVGGRPLYAPYPLSVTLPAMLIPHLLFFGPVEGLVTALVFSHLFKTNREILSSERPGISPLWVVLIALAALAPLGLIASAEVWGEWPGSEFTRLIGYVPEGMLGFENLWGGLLRDYGIDGINPSIGYIISAFLGSALAVFSIYVIIYVRIYIRGRRWRG